MPTDHDVATAAPERHLLPLTAAVDATGHLHVGGVDLLELARAPGVVVVESDGVGAPCTPEQGYLQSAPPASAAKLS